MTDLFPNPDDAQLALVKAAQAKRLAELNKLEVWTEYEFDLAFECYKEWWPTEKEWFPTSDGLNELIRNSRVPTSKKKSIDKWYQRTMITRSLSSRQN